MSLVDARTVPADPRSQERLREGGLDYRIVDWTDAAAAEAFARADERGFLNGEPVAQALTEIRAAFDARRNVGVYEPGAAPDDLPVATVNSWVAPMTVPGGEVPMWSVSVVTVAATHRRRGIARALLEGELRAAAGAGVPLAGLTVSEATIYGRYGFGPAVPAARVRVDTRRAGWAAPASPGRLEYVGKEQLAAALGEVHERSRGRRSGQVPAWERRWAQMAGLATGDEKASAVRGVRYLDEDGVVRGAMAYTVDKLPDVFGADLDVRHLAAETPEALRALWGFALNHDLVRTVTADLRPLDDPLPWLVDDQRAVEVTPHDHGWLRILDVPAALSARTYSAEADVVLAVTDSLGFADGTWRLRIGADGTASVERSDADPDARLGVAALSSLYAGGVPAAQLRAAGRIEASARTAAVLDAAFRTVEAPLLGIWY